MRVRENAPTENICRICASEKSGAWPSPIYIGINIENLKKWMSCGTLVAL